MAHLHLNRDRETLFKLCEVLDIDPQGLVELKIEWAVKQLVCFTTKYINEARVKPEPDLKHVASMCADESDRRAAVAIQ